MTTSIKITALNDIAGNLSHGTIIPVVDVTGAPVTDKANLQIIGNLFLSGAGGANFVAAAKATVSATVTDAAQANITSVGTLSELGVEGNITTITGMFNGDGGGLGNIVADSAATAAFAFTAGSVTSNAQGNITSVGTLTGLAVNGITVLGAVADVRISGGAATNVLITDGLGNLSWSAGSGGTSGYSGINGATGTSGYSGIDGTNGSQGTSGYSGIDGTNGSQGTSGYSGTNGSQGTSGYSGIDGTNGSQGTSGYSGTNGSQGTSGYSGVTGFEAAYSSGYSVLADGPSSNQFSVTGDVTAGFTPGKIVKFTILTEAEFTVDTAVYDGVNLWTVVTLLEVIGGPVIGDAILFEVSGINEIYPADTMAFTLNGPILTMGVTGIYFPGHATDWAGSPPTTIYAALDRLANASPGA